MTPRFDFIGMVTSDMPAALAFYRHLGLDIPPEADAQPHVEAATPSGVRLAWDSEEVARSVHPDWEMPSGPGRVALAFRCDTPAEVDHAYRELTAAGYSGASQPWDAFWGQRYAQVLDPDGNTVDLYAPLA